jgi:hypothetical protein
MSSRGFSGQSLNFQGLVAGSAEGSLIRGADGKSISLGTSTGADNGTDVIYIGYRTGFGNNAGANCTFLGNNAGCSDGSGPIFDCVLIGEDAARYAMPTADSNVSLGNHTLNFVMIGHENCAIGDSSMRNAGSGNLNVAVGARSFASCGDGSGNVALGGYAGQFQQDAVNSVFVGFQSGRGANESNLGGEWNIAIGARAGYSVAQGSKFNTLTGGESGFHTNSSSNTAFGFRSLFEQSPAGVHRRGNRTGHGGSQGDLGREHDRHRQLSRQEVVWKRKHPHRKPGGTEQCHRPLVRSRYVVSSGPPRTAARREPGHVQRTLPLDPRRHKGQTERV